MYRKRMIVLGVLGVCVLALTAGSLGVATGSAQASKHAAAKVTVIAVTAGKPTELAFKLSKFSQIHPGPITFKVTNAGRLLHDFKICTSAVKSVASNACVGKVTKLLKTGQSATLTVTITKDGKYEYLCTFPGHAAAGMKGLLGVGVTAAQSASAAATTNSKSVAPTSSPTTTSAATPSAPPAASSPPPAAGASECPAGQTIQQADAAGGGDEDSDDDGGPTDADGCI